MEKNVGDDFQTETKYARTKSLGGNLDWANKPETYKSYPSSKTVQLPNPSSKNQLLTLLRFFEDAKASAPSHLSL